MIDLPRFFNTRLPVQSKRMAVKLLTLKGSVDVVVGHLKQITCVAKVSVVDGNISFAKVADRFLQ